MKIGKTFFYILNSLCLSYAATSVAAVPAFPLPEGMQAAPSVLSPEISSAVSTTINNIMKLALINMAKTKTAPPSAPVVIEKIPVATFSPVVTPANIANSNASMIPNGNMSANYHGAGEIPRDLKKRIKHPFTGSFDIASLYVFRGISRSANSLAFQGDYTYTFLRSGIYAKVFGSNVDFYSRQNQHATVEADTIVGIKNTIKEDFTYDLNLVRYNYPKAEGANYNEFVSLLQYKILTFTLAYSSNAYNAHAGGFYYNGGLDIPIPAKYAFQYSDVFVFGHYGHYDLSEDVGLRSYNDFLLGIRKTVEHYTLQVAWKGTNNESEQKGLDANRIIGEILVRF